MGEGGASERKEFTHVCVIKIGSSTVIDAASGQINHEGLSYIAQTVSHLREREWGVIIVTSGAVGCGRIVCAESHDSLYRIPVSGEQTFDKKALAALGQGRLMSAWETAIAVHGFHTAHVLIGRADICDKARYANAHATLNAILSIGAIPVVNENDTASSPLHKVGDNDNLSALVSSMCSASLLVLLTDVDGLYTSNPSTDPNATRIPIVRNVASIELSTEGTGSSLGTGGMATKVEAAQVATATGTPTVVILGTEVHRIIDFVDAAESVFVVSGRRSPSGRGVMRGVAESHAEVANTAFRSLTAPAGCSTATSQESSDSEGDLGDDDIAPWSRATMASGTVFLPRVRAARARKRWVLAARTEGAVLLDEGAVTAVRAGKSLFAAGIVDIEGQWEPKSVVLLAAAADHSTVARGVLTMGSSELEKVLGMSSQEISEELGDNAGDVPVAHRSTIVPFFL